MKIDIDEVISALNEAKVDKEKTNQVLQHLEKVAQEIQEEKEKGALPKQKNEYGIIIYSDIDGLKSDDFTATVFTVKQGDDFNTVLARISDAAAEQNASGKRKKWALKSIGDACQNLKRVFLKNRGINIKTKEPVRVLVSKNNLV